MAAPKKLNLANLGGGELVALVDREITKLCENIADPAVKTEAVRKVNISIFVKPDKKGQTAEIKYGVKSVLPGPDASSTTAYIAMAPGTTDIALFGMDIRQQDLFQRKEDLTTEITPVNSPTSAPAETTATFAPPMTHN